MQRFILGCVILFPQSVGAFIDNDAIGIESKKLDIEIVGDQVHTTITLKVNNPTANNQNLTWSFPLEVGASEVNIFWDGAGRSFEVLKEENRLDRIFDLSVKTQSSVPFRMAMPIWPQFFQSSELTARPKTSHTLKFKYTKSLDFISDIFLTETFLNDQLGVERFEVALSINREKPILHHLPIANIEGSFIQEGGRLGWSAVLENPEVVRNFRFLFSEQPTPTLSFASAGHLYTAKFSTPKPQFWNKTLLVIDASGSMYGDRWNRLEDLLPELLQLVPSSSQLQVVLWNEEMTNLSDGYKANTRDLQSSVFSAFYQYIPTGKNTWEGFTNLVEKSALSTQDTLLIVSDFKDFILPETALSESQTPARIVALNMGVDNEDLDFWTALHEGFTQRLFSTGLQFLEAEALKTKLLTLRRDRLAETRGGLDFPFYKSEIKLNRVESEAQPPQSFVARFLPSLWARQYSLAQIHRHFWEQPLGAEEREGLVSIARAFGVVLPWLNESTSLISFEAFLESPVVAGFWGDWWRLADAPLNINRNAYLQNQKPLYQTDDIAWEQYNFPDQVRADTLLRISPLSEAHRSLFKAFPGILSEGFGAGLYPRFCVKNRCLHFTQKGREEARDSDKLYWKGYHLDHWSNSYIHTLAERDLFPLDKDGNAEPDIDITRGEFIQMLTPYYYDNADLTSIKTVRFKDLKPTDKVAKFAEFLADEEIIQGYADQTFRPNQRLTRAEGVKILLSIQGFSPEGSPLTEERPFGDVPGWEAFWALKAYENNIVQGFPDGTFRPHTPLTRGQAAKIVVEGKN